MIYKLASSFPSSLSSVVSFSAKATASHCRFINNAKRNMSIEILSTTTVSRGGGVMHRVKHASTSTKTDMIFAIFLPSAYKADKSVVLPAICE